ncbi:hypothetical protein [Bacillus sp. FSL K6-0268]|uniref:hypothetical protein n=1 Tax=Bacillus sp. FSL K6-0268 TaxID=2921449 RepID=UPI0030F72AA1
MKTRKNFKKIAPITLLSAAILCSPASSFAAENTTGTPQQSSDQQSNTPLQERVIQGYLFKDGVKTPVYTSGIKNRSEAPYPILPSNPNDPIPEKGSIHSESGDAGPMLYFSSMNLEYSILFMNGRPPSQGFPDPLAAAYNISIEKLTNGSLEFSYYDPETLERKPFATINSQHPKYALYNNAFTGNKVKRDTSFQKVGSGLTPRNGTYTFSDGLTYGLSKTDAGSVALEIGYKMTIKAGGGILPAETTHEISSKLTGTYSHSINVTEQHTQTQTLSSGTTPTPASYPYDYFWGVTYQLKSDYTVVPGDGLNTLTQQRTATLAKKMFTYNDNDFYLAVTPGSR